MFLRTPWVAGPLFLVFLLFAGIGWVRALLWLDAADWSGGAYLAAFFAVVVAIVGIGALISAIYARMFPPFEVRVAGRTSRRRQVTQAIGVAVGAIVTTLTIIQGVITLTGRAQ